jgi:hypothetical protein
VAFSLERPVSRGRNQLRTTLAQLIADEGSTLQRSGGRLVLSHREFIRPASISSASRAGLSQAARGPVRGCLEFAPSQDATHHKEPTMSRIDTLIQRSIAVTLAALVTLAMMGSIDGLASRDVAADAVLSQQATPAQKA